MSDCVVCFACLGGYVGCCVGCLFNVLSVGRLVCVVCVGLFGRIVSWTHALRFPCVVFNCVVQRSWLTADTSPATNHVPKFVVILRMQQRINACMCQQLCSGMLCRRRMIEDSFY